MYSDVFRSYVSHITGSGPLSGRKTDMAINVYTPGCYLLCHDDVIGSRKVSYILYLTDPDTPWQREWGGALRLFPVTECKGKDGEIARTPAPDVAKAIPPAWNQLSFFAVQPGESFHDVEEVYHAETEEQLQKEGGRVRMAISGWFHIPQIGEEGYVEGAEEAQVKNSGLMQLQGNPDQHDQPQPRPVQVEKEDSQSSLEFDEADLDFLLKYIAPAYLTPDTLMNVVQHFDETSSVVLPDILNKKFAERLRAYITKQESIGLPEDSADIEKGAWKVAQPPHKQRFLYMQPDSAGPSSPIRELLDELLPSKQFCTWLEMATNTNIETHDFKARRFRRGKDYTLATGYEGKPRLELNLGLTPTPGWGDDSGETDEAKKGKAKQNGNGAHATSKGKDKPGTSDEEAKEEELAEVGGHEVYMAADDADDEDVAIYKTSNGEANILFFQAAAWNKMTIVMCDSGALRFVKYVSRKAGGDRWDVAGILAIEEDYGEEDADTLLLESSEEEFRGFSPSSDSDSD